jgi:hypothetical protein
MNNWAKFRRLPLEEKVLLLEALALLPAVRLGLRTLGMRPVEAALARRIGAGRRAEPDRAIYRARRTARLVSVAAGFVGGACLARSIVLAWLLERQGVPAQLRIGVRKDENGFEAHAWVEAAGVVLNGGSNSAVNYAAFDRDFAVARGNCR